MSSVIGDFSLTIEPETWTDVAVSVAALVAARISAGVLSATPLPEDEDEPPQPASAPTASRAASDGTVIKGFLTFIAAGTLQTRTVAD